MFDNMTLVDLVLGRVDQIEGVEVEKGEGSDMSQLLPSLIVS